MRRLLWFVIPFYIYGIGSFILPFETAAQQLLYLMVIIAGTLILRRYLKKKRA
ncbi:membrane protein implicated in regulation of membrane protease activity [Ereboglobus sp. PH5-10]|nr:membrane protein implicated in regulation of membrane protease activity [Ereboglobus sp. PH5-10]